MTAHWRRSEYCVPLRSGLALTSAQHCICVLLHSGELESKARDNRVSTDKLSITAAAGPSMPEHRPLICSGNPRACHAQRHNLRLVTVNVQYPHLSMYQYHAQAFITDKHQTRAEMSPCPALPACPSQLALHSPSATCSLKATTECRGDTSGLSRFW